MSDHSTSFAGCAVILAVFAVAGCATLAKNNHREQHRFTVSSTDRQCDRTGDTLDCYYVVFGTEGEVFENRDSGFLNGKWDSASMQARFLPGHTYEVTTIGWRNPLFSMKPNIVSMEEIGQPNAVVPMQGAGE